MNKIKMLLRGKAKSNALLVLSLVVLVAVVLGTMLIGNFVVNQKNCYVDNAVFDLTDAQLDLGNPVYLNGQWEFFYGSFIVTDKIDSPAATAYLDVPNSWSSVIDEAGTFEAGGFGSYRCKIVNVKANSYLTLYIPNIASAYRVYINGALVTTSGNVAKISNQIWSTASHDSIPFLLEEDGEYEVVVEISANNNSGLYMPVVLANYNTENAHESSILATHYVFGGVLLFCAILFIVLKYSVNRQLYSLWLPVLSVLLVIRAFITNEGYTVIQPLLFDISFEDISVFVFISTFIIKLVSLIYMNKCLNLKVKDNIFVAYSFVFLGIAIGLNFLPNSIFDTYYYVIFQLLSSIIDIYIINKLCIEICKKTEDANLYLLSYMFIVVGITIDVLYTNGIILFPLSTCMPICFAAFAIITTIIHAKRIKKMHDYALESQRLEKELERANTSIMLSQIQPHFLYNALNTIKSLVKRDPEKAENAIIDFSLYLRGNMDSLTKVDPIPITEELEHVKKYCNIEQLRFSDKLEIFFEIDSEDFYVPTLSVQPIVENAIKHGVTKKAEGGSVTISTYEDEDNYYIKVEDDGVGFDTNAPHKDTSRSHVGIKNITERLESIMSAEVTIESKIGVGTTVTVRLPKEKNVKTLQESLEILNSQSLFKEMNI